MEQTITLDPRQKYSISCTENSKLFLKLSDFTQIIRIKLSQNARLTFVYEKPIGLKIKSVKLADSSVLTIPASIIYKIDKENIMNKSCIITTFESWEELKQTGLSFLNVSPQD
jgi:hypothetical protein